MRQAGHLHHSADIGWRILRRQETALGQHHSHAVAQAAPHAGHFHAVGKAVVGVVVFGEGVYLRFAPQPPERAGKHHSVVIDVEIGAQRICAFLAGGGNGGHQPAVLGLEALGAEQLLPVHVCPLVWLDKLRLPEN